MCDYSGPPLDLLAPCAVYCGRGGAPSFRLEKSAFQVVRLSILFGVALPGSLRGKPMLPQKSRCADYSQTAGLLIAALRPGRGTGGPRHQPGGLKDSEPAALGSSAVGSLCPRPPMPRPLAGLPVSPAHDRPARRLRLRRSPPPPATASAPEHGQRRRPRAWTEVEAVPAAFRLPAPVRKGSSGRRGSPWPQTAAPRTGRADGSADPAHRPSQHPRPSYPQ